MHVFDSSGLRHQRGDIGDMKLIIEIGSECVSSSGSGPSLASRLAYAEGWAAMRLRDMTFHIAWPSQPFSR
jgi:hypothetical protein